MTNFVLMSMGAICMILPWGYLLPVFPRKKDYDFRKFIIVTSGASVALIIYAATNAGIRFENALCIVLIPAGVCMLSIFSIIKMPDLYDSKNNRTMKLKKEEYRYITQDSPIDPNGIMTQDFPYTSNYIYIPKTDEYVLLTRYALETQHDIEIIIRPDKKRGQNIYECTKLTITDGKTSLLEKYLWLMKYWCFGTALMGSVGVSYMINHTGMGINLSVSPQKMMMFLLIEFVGSIMTLSTHLVKHRIEKILFLVFGTLLVIAGFIPQLC